MPVAELLRRVTEIGAKHVVVTDALPKNPSGKILKRDLRGLHADLADSQEQAQSSGS